MLQEISQLFNRDLERLKIEIELFNAEDKLWQITGSITNPAGNLCLHLIGNLNTYIGQNLGQIHYIRNRDLEFSQKDVPKTTLIREVSQTKIIVADSLNTLTETDLEKLYPEDVLGYSMTTCFFLIHLAAHLSYHLGQINYLRRILS